jgi:hypothetical protein
MNEKFRFASARINPPADPVRFLWSPPDGRTRNGRVVKPYTRGMTPVNGPTVKAQRHSAEPKQLTVSSWQTRFWTKKIDE